MFTFEFVYLSHYMTSTKQMEVTTSELFKELVRLQSKLCKRFAPEVFKELVRLQNKLCKRFAPEVFWLILPL